MSQSVQRTELENGVCVLCEPMAEVRSVSVGVLIGAGSRDEGDGEHGYAHLLEHMLFQGTGERDARVLAEMMEIGGGSIGAFTTREYTVYHASVLDEYLTFALEALGDMLCNATLPTEALARQRGVILNEIAGQGDPLARANQLLKTALWPNHPLGYPTVGSAASIKDASQDALRAFMTRHYVGSNVAVAVAGSVEPGQLFSQVRDALWQLPAGEGPALHKHQPPPPAHQLGKLTVEPHDYGQVYFTLAWPAPPYADGDRYAWHVFSSLYGASATSRLYRRLREELGLVYHIDAQYQAYQNTGALVVEGATRPETLVPVLANVLFELFNMTSEPLDLDAHYHTIQSLISQHLVAGDSPYVRMSRLALQEFYFGRVVPSEEVSGALREQSGEAIQAVAASLVNAGLPTMALVGPVTEKLITEVSDLLTDLGGSPSIELIPEPAQVAVPA